VIVEESHLAAAINARFVDASQHAGEGEDIS
jgi:hypothetical protein